VYYRENFLSPGVNIMRRIFTAALLLSCALANACGGGGQAGPSNNARPAAQANSASKGTNANSSPSNSSAEIGPAPSHGGGAASPAGSTSSAGSADEAPASTAELDANVKKADAKVKAGGLSESDKKAAAEAYFARADHFRDAGQPRLYKFALADYRRGLRLDPSNSEARERMDEIVQIYKSMGRPVPELGNEP